MFPCLNINSLIFFGIDLLRIKSWNYNAWAILLFFILIILLNYYRVYKTIGLKSLIKRWDNVEDRKKRQLTVWMFAYLVITVIVLFISIVY